ncbi:hypothetical protein L596_022567 [Steinernema carpocapsae]|uniref:Uncharacterized protein n=1 Tax=Steinernema carpocapsae TaxID=34508 RepID=A0A4U5MM29_STECR|nr:hypothetical protein L596_022567 [Steinernema carpocapsae]
MERIQKACGLDLTETMKNCSGRIGMVEKVSSDASIADVSFYIFAPPLNGLPSRQESVLFRVVCKWNSQALRMLRTFHTCTGDKVAWIKGHNTARPVMASVEVVNVKQEIYQMVVTKKRFPFNRDTFPTDVILPIYNGRKLEGVLRELPIPKTDFQAVDRLVFGPSMKTVFMHALDPREWCLPYGRHERSIRDPRKALGPFSPGAVQLKKPEYFNRLIRIEFCDTNVQAQEKAATALACPDLLDALEPTDSPEPPRRARESFPENPDPPESPDPGESPDSRLLRRRNSIAQYLGQIPRSPAPPACPWAPSGLLGPLGPAAPGCPSWPGCPGCPGTPRGPGSPAGPESIGITSDFTSHLPNSHAQIQKNFHQRKKLFA